MKKKLAFAVLAVLIAVLPLSAATWMFSSSYPEVTNFRYQFNTDKADNWIVVGPNDTTQSFDVPDGTTVYVQQSLDHGKSWSRSASATFRKAPAPKTQTGVIEAGEMTVEVPKRGGKTEPLKRPFEFALGFKFPVLGFAFPEEGATLFGADQGFGLEMRFKNVVSTSRNLGMHIMWNIDASFLPLAADGFPKDFWKDTQKVLSTDLIFAFSGLVSEGKGEVWFGIGPGVDFAFNSDVLSQCWPFMETPVDAPEWLNMGPFTVGTTLFGAADFGLEWNLGDTYSLGLGYRFKYSFESFSDWGHNRMANSFTLRNIFTF